MGCRASTLLSLHSIANPVNTQSFICADFNKSIVTTSHGARPTPQNCKPVNGVMGRGSIVFLNQASLFQHAELGGTVADTLSRGQSIAANNDGYMDGMLRFDVA